MPEDGVALALISFLFRLDLSLRWRAPMTGPGAGADTIAGNLLWEEDKKQTLNE